MKTIELTKGGFALIDDEDFDKIKDIKWCLHDSKSTRYAYSTNWGNKSIIMHRLLMNVNDPKLVVDHIDGNGLNNQKENLRICSQAKNNQNSGFRNNTSSKFKGVSWHKNLNKWTAQIGYNKKLYHIGVFKDEMEAAKAYDKKARELFGEFANPNFKII